MWDGLVMLLFMSIVMGAASFLAGSLPLTFSLAPRQLRLLTALGTGILVGTSLIVIIPEGVETLYSAGGSGHGHSRRGLHVKGGDVALRPLVARGGDPLRRDAFPAAITLEESDTPFMPGIDDDFGAGQRFADFDPPSVMVPDHSPETPPFADHEQDGSNRGESPGSDEYEPHAWIGVSLILGFILMYLIDTLPQMALSPSQPERSHFNLGDLSFNRPASTSSANMAEEANESFATTGTAAGRGKRSRHTSTTLGLVIHAAADGIALGASSTTSASNLGFVVFIALMIHKAPAAFGLSSVLLKQGLSKRMARAHLIVFSLAAPAGALLTWAAVHLLGFQSHSFDETTGPEFATGVLLLFSGGTFLYVAMHTMQDHGSSSAGTHSHADHGGGMDGYSGVPMDDPYAAHGPPPPKTQSPALVDTLVTVGGMLLPLLTQWGHAH